MNQQLTNFLERHIEAGEFPSAVYLVAERDEIVFTDALGYSVVEPYRVANKLDTIYDLASLTKPLVTALLCARRIELGELTLDSSVSHYLGEFDRTDKQTITVRELLTHTSGLPAWRPLYLLTEDEPERAAGAIANLELEYKPGTRVVYSDLGYIALGILLERMSHQKLADMAKREIFEPLKLQNTFFNPPPTLRKRIAASEKGNEYEKQICVNSGFDVSNYDWRDYQIRGEVHDGNCYFMNGVSGHAGLFSTVEETLKIAEQFLPRTTRILKPETCQLFRTNFTMDLNEARSIAFQLAATKDSTAGEALSNDGFGHLGFTGTSLWIDPDKERVFILLTNRTHARSLPFANINSVRRRFHEWASRLLNEK
jgi:CubicO group peptidase (beta-lactamase class C family)